MILSLSWQIFFPHQKFFFYLIIHNLHGYDQMNQKIISRYYSFKMPILIRQKHIGNNYLQVQINHTSTGSQVRVYACTLQCTHSIMLLLLHWCSSSFKGTIWPDWYNWIGIEKEINRNRFLIFNFWSSIYFKSSKFWATSCKNESKLLLVWITVCMCSNSDLFYLTLLPKCWRDINCSLDYGSWVKSSNIPQSKPKRAALWRIFLSNKTVPANRKTGEIGFISAWSVFKYSRVKLKNQKPIAVDVLFKAYPMVKLSCRSNLAGRYL